MAAERVKVGCNISSIRRLYVNHTLRCCCSVCGCQIEGTTNQEQFEFVHPGKTVQLSLKCEECEREHKLPVRILGTHVEIEYDYDELKAVEVKKNAKQELSKAVPEGEDGQG